ncbi:hypothetical protein [Rhodococcus tibetensis]|uniref:Uncharacterized protein n=1 Tax=Rhodococcus tibetensis TaxID=2965064 RepID=A0ABT1QCR5_9NOCA|nr:hypothetical protein [Rhodococcus sp. FXJ9.536]MCQ4120007.1 hypothetical protein [Rhodococcus sp. FXJ9.536]
MTADDAAIDSRSQEFASAWAHHDMAENCRSLIQTAWNELGGSDLFGTWIGADDDGSGSIAVTVDWPPEAQELQKVAREFVEELHASLDDAVSIAEKIVSGSLTTPDNPARFPLCSNLDEFIAHDKRGGMAGLRPDHMQLLEAFQPFADDPAIDMSVNLVRRTMRLLSSVTTRSTNSEVVTVWAHSASPIVLVDTPQVVAGLTVEPAGRVVDAYTVARFRLEPAGPARHLRGNPQVALDIAFNAEPWPIDPNDTFALRCHQLLVVTAEVVRSFERSFGLRSTEVRDRNRGGGMPPSHERDTSTWAPVDSSAVPELEIALSESDLGLAVYRDGDEMIMIVNTEDGVFGRIVPQPVALDPDLRRGIAAENATLGAAARWGLPDFVLTPLTVSKSTATRELGDGTVIFGNRALAIQVKARDHPGPKPERERAWIAKNAAKGARQAAGSVRSLSDTPVSMTNVRGRSIKVDGKSLDWVGVVIVDHDDPPDNIAPVESTPALPIVVLLRREWEFLFDHLRSVTALGSYLHRIKGDAVAPGDHPGHYYELATADERATPNPGRLPVALGSGEQRFSYPLLPMEPASSLDEQGAAMFRQMLEDLATSPWDRPEEDRLTLLHLLDRQAVTERARVGRRMISLLRGASSVSREATRFDLRRYVFGEGDLQLGFGVCNKLSAHHREAFRRWVMLRHHEWTETLPSDGREDIWTVAILLTPRHDGLRPWDITVFAIYGVLEIDESDLEALDLLWNRPSAEINE